MEKNKTAMQELIEELHTASKAGSNGFITTTINLIIDMVESKLEKEKHQILEAFHSGDNSDCTSEQNAYEFAEQYYKDTYEK